MYVSAFFVFLTGMIDASVLIGAAYLFVACSEKKKAKAAQPPRRACDARCTHFGSSNDCCNCIRNPAMLDHYDVGGA